jgi:hypothetical protein
MHFQIGEAPKRRYGYALKGNFSATLSSDAGGSRKMLGSGADVISDREGAALRPLAGIFRGPRKRSALSYLGFLALGRVAATAAREAINAAGWSGRSCFVLRELEFTAEGDTPHLRRFWFDLADEKGAEKEFCHARI